MKKIISILLIITVVFVTAGCIPRKCYLCGDRSESYNKVKKYKYYGKDRYLCELCYADYLVDLYTEQLKKYY
jgi:transposase-like protein